MKNRLFLLGLLGVFLVASCSIGTGDSDYSPQLVVNSVSLNGTTVTSIDTLAVGDVLVINGTASGVSKPLTSLLITNDSDYSTIAFPDASSLDSSILDNGYTDLSNGYFYFSGLGIYSFTFNLQYTATKAIKSGAKLTFVVSSTSQYSPMTYAITLPAK